MVQRDNRNSAISYGNRVFIIFTVVHDCYLPGTKRTANALLMLLYAMLRAINHGAMMCVIIMVFFK